MPTPSLSTIDAASTELDTSGIDPTDPAALRTALEVFATITDPRARRGVRHSCPAILAVACAAMLAGAQFFAAMAQWARSLPDELAALLGLHPSRRPSEPTIRASSNE